MQEIIRLLDQGADIDAASKLDLPVRDYNAPTSTIGDLIQFDAVETRGSMNKYRRLTLHLIQFDSLIAPG